jgi:MFS transporter, SP family, arabinose:H+ symporter
MASALYGTVVGSLLGGWPADRFGRKATLLWIGVLYFVGAVGSGLGAQRWRVHRGARHRRTGHRHLHRGCAHVHLGDRSAQASRTARRHVPVQHCFRHPDRFVSNALLAGIGENAWRWMLGVAAFPSLLYAPYFALAFPKARAGCSAARATARPALRSAAAHRAGASGRDRSRGRRDYGCIASEQGSSGHFWTMRLRKPILLAILIAFFNQMSGINAILYFAPRIFELTGLGAKAALLQSIGIGSPIWFSLLSASG